MYIYVKLKFKFDEEKILNYSINEVYYKSKKGEKITKKNSPKSFCHKLDFCCANFLFQLKLRFCLLVDKI